MKRLFALAVLMMLGSPVHAADSISFVIAGHRIHIGAPRHCNSASCFSVSIPGVYAKRGRDRPDDDDRSAPVASSVSAPPAMCAPAVAVRPAAAPMQQAAASRPQIQPPMPPPTTAMIAPLPPPPAPLPPPAITRPADLARPAPEVAPRISKTSNEVEEEQADTPLGDWQAAGQKGVVRIEPCGQALCGYSLDAASNTKGETVLVDMKSKTASEWAGNIYSRASGNVYYGTIAMKGPNSLKVEACALGRFFCSGTVWSRVDARPDSVISDREVSPQQRS